MAFQNIYVDKKNGNIHLWDDVDGYGQFPLSKVQYAYRRKVGGEYKSLYGDELERVSCEIIEDPNLFESDIHPEIKFLLDHYADNDDVSHGHKIVVIDIETDTTNGYPKVNEGDKAITAIALYEQSTNTYYSLILDPESKIDSGKQDNIITYSFRNEDELLSRFLRIWEEVLPTIVTGWNINRFDIPYIFHRIRNVKGKNAVYRLSPIGICYQNKFTEKMTVAGISCIDYLELYKKFRGEMKSSYSLANIAKEEELTIQKLTYKGSLNDLYKTDLKRYVEYNLVDVQVVVELDKKYDFIHLCQAVCHKGHVPYEWYQMSSRWIDGAILGYLHKKNLIAPNKPIGGREEYEEMEKDGEDGFIGAYVKDPIAGLYDWVLSADITSLYPSVIMSLNISPETKLGKIENWDRSLFDNGTLSSIRMCEETYSIDDFKERIKNYNLAIAGNGAVYRQDTVGVVPAILDTWFNERVQYRKMAKEFSDKGDKEKSDFYNRRQNRQKIFLNSVYGVLGLPIFRFYDRDNAEAVTLSGQMIIKGAEKIVNSFYVNRFMERGVSTSITDFVIYIDTDSNYISASPLAKLDNIPEDNMMEFTINLAKQITERINKFYEYMIPRIFNVPPAKNRIKIIPDVIAKKALWMAKKRYAMLKVYDMEKDKLVKDKMGNIGKLEVKGIDVVRSSYPASFRKFSGEILEMLLRDANHDVIDEKIMKFEEDIDKNTVANLAKTTSVKFISKDGETNYNPRGRRTLQFIKKTPVGVKSALAYNDLLKIWNLEVKFEPILHNSKIKWVYLLPNDFFIDALAAKYDDTDPDEILNFIESHIDRKKMYDKELRTKLDEFYGAIGRKMPNRGSQMAEKTFDFNDSW